MTNQSTLQRLLAWFKQLFGKQDVQPRATAPEALVVQSKASLTVTKSEIIQKSMVPVFWRSEITGVLYPHESFLILYFCVCRTASAACRIQKAVLERMSSTSNDAKAEILRLVGWDLEVPHVVLEVSINNSRWVCKQRNEFGVREPFGYVVLTTAFAPGLLNSIRLTSDELHGPPIRYLLKEDSSCTKQFQGEY